MQISYHYLKAFTRQNKGGNPAAIVTTDGLSDAQKQEIAGKIGFSETAFISRKNGRWFIEFYTPEKSIAYCGHATIAAFNLLRNEGLMEVGRHSILTKHDPIDIVISDSMVQMEQAYPIFFEVNKHEIASFTGLPPQEIRRAVIARNGVGYLLIELDDAEKLYSLEIDESAVYSFSEENDLIGIYPFAKKDAKIYSRMFAPFYGIKEENATGMAAGLSGGWLHLLSGNTESAFTIEQGYSAAMKERGILEVEITSNDNAKRVLVGGQAFCVSRETISILAPVISLK
jgi:PhzF family phenazine biosynthesis protein